MKVQSHITVKLSFCDANQTKVKVLERAIKSRFKINVDNLKTVIRNNKIHAFI